MKRIMIDGGKDTMLDVKAKELRLRIAWKVRSGREEEKYQGVKMKINEIEG